jgi:hypothetical protein
MKKMSIILPRDFDKLRERVLRAISPLRPSAGITAQSLDFLLTAGQTQVGRDLPAHYLIYFMLVDLLRFQDLGHSEKIAWAIPVDFNGKAFTIEYRKFGIGVYTRDAEKEEDSAKRIIGLIWRGVAAAGPFFEWLATTAVNTSKLNVKNNCGWLFERFLYLQSRFQAASAEADERKDESLEHTTQLKNGITCHTIEFPYYELKRNSTWLGLAAVDAFFSWTEHLFIHIAILQGHLTAGDQVAELADSEWNVKFKTALDLSDATTKQHFDKLIVIRRQLRNYIAHGAFGKNGEAFHFHSIVGAVPVLLTQKPGKGRFMLAGGGEFDEDSALKEIDEFIAHLWSGSCAPARIYLEEASLPTILTMASDGTYASAMRSVKDMEAFVDEMARRFDDAANMDR